MKEGRWGVQSADRKGSSMVWGVSDSSSDPDCTGPVHLGLFLPAALHPLRVKCHLLGNFVPCPVQSHQYQPLAQARLCSSTGHKSGVWEVCRTGSSHTGLGCLVETFQTKLKVQGKCPSYPHLFSRYKLAHLTTPDPKRPQMSAFSGPPFSPQPKNVKYQQTKVSSKLGSEWLCPPRRVCRRGCLGFWLSPTDPFKPTMLSRLKLLLTPNHNPVPTCHCTPSPNLKSHCESSSQV